MVVPRNHQLVNVSGLVTAGVPLGFTYVLLLQGSFHTLFSETNVYLFLSRGEKNPYVLAKATLVLL